MGYSVQQTNDGGYIVAGITVSYRNGADAWLIKVNANGFKEWDKTFGGSGDDYAVSIQQTTDGGYIIGGFTDSYGADLTDAWIIKTDANGNKKWEKTFGGMDMEMVHMDRCVQQTNDGGYIIAGRASPSFSRFTPPDVWLIKTDKKGNAMR